MFVAIGLVIIFRIIKEHNQSERNANYQMQSLITCPGTTIIIAVWIIIDGIVCCQFSNNWYFYISMPKRTLIYCGIAIPFIIMISFIITDIINFIILNFTANTLKPIIESNYQFIALTMMSVFMGIVYGLVFGVVDCDTISLYKQLLQLMMDDSYPYTIGFILGMLEGFINEVIKDNKGYLHVKGNRSEDYFDDL